MWIQRDFSLKSLNTFGLNVKADYYLRIQSTEELTKFYAESDHWPKPWFFLGGGSNILFSEDFKGTVIHIDLRGRKIESETDESAVVSAYAGENWHEFVRYSLQLNLGGLENLSLIPGNCGTAPVQNIGAYGVELKDCFHHLEAFDLKEGKLVEMNGADCDFSYRNSLFKVEKGRYIILKIFLELSKKPELRTSYGAIQSELLRMNIQEPDIHDVARAVVRIRMTKLPDPALLGNCGSFFKNPVVSLEKAEDLLKQYPDMPVYPLEDPQQIKIPAGWLIEQSGWKGKQVGQVGMHEKQALVLVNYGGAESHELIAHARSVKESVEQRFGIKLEEEVNIL